MQNGKNITAALMLIVLFIFIPLKLIAQWSQVGTFGTQSVFSIVDAGGPMVAGTSVSILTSGDLYISPPGGNNWSIVSTGMNLSGVFALVYKDNIVFAGTYEDGLWKSTNSGMNWIPVNVNGNFGTGIFKLGVSGQNLFAYANTGSAYYVSTNNGLNWSVPSGFTGGITSQLLDNGLSFYAATNKGLYLSTDHGLTWSARTNAGLPVNPDGSKRVASLVVFNNKVFCSTTNPVNSVYVSTNEGNNWSQTSLVVPDFGYVKTMERTATKIFAGIFSGSGATNGVMVTMDEGATWSPVNGGLPGNVNINALLRTGNNLFACTGSNGIWKADIDQLTGSLSGTIEIPKGFTLEQNYPNPFNPSTKIIFSIPVTLSGKEAVLKIFDINGMALSEKIFTNITPGKHEFEFSVYDNASGVYFYELTAGNFTISKKMILIK